MPDEACADFSTHTRGRFAQRRAFTADAQDARLAHLPEYRGKNAKKNRPKRRCASRQEVIQ